MGGPDGCSPPHTGYRIRLTGRLVRPNFRPGSGAPGSLSQWLAMKLYAAPLDFRHVAREYDVPTEFAPEVRAEAAQLTDRHADERRDARDIALVTIDPVGSKDLDQAFRPSREGPCRS